MVKQARVYEFEEGGSSGSGGKIGYIFGAMIGLLILGGVFWVFKDNISKFFKREATSGTFSSPLPNSPANSVGRSGYFAIFLNNGQVYFGRLKDKDSQYPVLSEVYYLRAQKSLQEEAASITKIEKGKPVAPESGASDITLIKLGNELHGPVDEMILNRDQILFIEEMRDDSKIVKAIKDFKQK